MRETLSLLEGKRRWFGCVYAGTDVPAIADTLKNPPLEPLALLQNIFLENDLITDHLWSSWAQQFRSFPPGSKLEFLGTVQPYAKKHGWDYGLDEVCWVQAVGRRQAMIKKTAPQSQAEATYLLSLFNYAYKRMSQSRLQKLDRPNENTIIEAFEADYCADLEVRFRHWNPQLPDLLTSLALEGWAKPRPRNLIFWLEQSPALNALSDLPDQAIMQCAQIASWMNGASLWQAFGKD